MALGGAFLTAVSISKLKPSCQGRCPAALGLLRPLRRLKPPLCPSVLPPQFRLRLCSGSRNGMGEPSLRLQWL